MIHREISNKTFQIDSVDGLRGFAALIVVFSHASNAGMLCFPFLDLSGVGKSGVFLFFLLSSFLLTLGLLQKGKHVFSFPVMSQYWQRRFFRIYPLYTLYLLLGLISTLLLSYFLGASGVGVPFSLDYFEFIKHLALIEGKGVTWSIAVEFKFYFILPFFVIVIVFIRSYGILTLTIFFSLLFILSQLVFPQRDSIVNDPRLLPYMPIFISGMFVAVFQGYINSAGLNNRMAFFLKYCGIIGFFGIVAMTPIVYSALWNSVANDYFHKEFILHSLCWSLVLLSAINHNGLLRKLFTSYILRFYGQLSFSLYLFHPVIIGVVYKLKLNAYLSSWIVLLATTLVAYVSFKYLEWPVSRYSLKRIRFA